MRTFYVVYADFRGGLHTREIDLEGKANVDNIEKTLKKSVDYSERSNVNIIVSWQEVEPFTYEEREEFWNSYFD